MPGIFSKFASTRSTFQPGRLSPTSVGGARPALPAALDVHERARALGEGADRQHHVRRVAQALGQVAGRGDHERTGERLGRRREIVRRVDAAEQADSP